MTHVMTAVKVGSQIAFITRTEKCGVADPSTDTPNLALKSCETSSSKLHNNPLNKQSGGKGYINNTMAISEVLCAHMFVSVTENTAVQCL